MHVLDNYLKCNFLIIYISFEEEKNDTIKMEGQINRQNHYICTFGRVLFQKKVFKNVLVLLIVV